MSGDDFAEKAAEMQRPIKKFIPGARTIAYGIGFFLLFGLAAGQVGLTSQQLQKYGDPVVRYPNAQTKHLVGLLLFSGIASLLIALGSPYLPLYFLAFIVFAISVIDITSAGLLHHQLPFGTKCNGNGGNYGVWTGFVSDCKIYTGLEGVSWAKWAVGLIIAVALFADAFTHAKKHHKRHYVYGQ